MHYMRQKRALAFDTESGDLVHEDKVAVLAAFCTAKNSERPSSAATEESPPSDSLSFDMRERESVHGACRYET